MLVHHKHPSISNHYPKAYIEYLVYFHAERDYFECHEVLEEFWKQEVKAANRPIWHGLIQVAVALYHERRGNKKGAIKMMQSAWNVLSQQSMERIGLDGDEMLKLLADRLQQLQHNDLSYEDMNLPLKDPELVKTCLARCEAKQLHWGAPSDLTNLELIHKHKLRDRSDVISEREAAIQARKERKRKRKRGLSKRSKF